MTIARRPITFLLAVILFAAAPLANATLLLGTTASLTPMFGNFAFATQTATVGPAVEFPIIPNYSGVSADINDTQVSIASTGTVFGPGAFNGFVFSFSGVTLTGVSLDPASTFTPFSFLISNNTLRVDFEGQFNRGGVTILDVTGRTSVPEPESIALLGIGMLAAVSVAARRRKSPAA